MSDANPTEDPPTLAIDRLLSIAGPALAASRGAGAGSVLPGEGAASGPSSPMIPSPTVPSEGPVLEDLRRLLARRDGFLAFESALWVLPSGSGPRELAGWNHPDGWRSAYGELADGLLFFALDAFAGQFATDGRAVVRFDPETGEREALAASLEGWAQLLLRDYEFQTGHPLAHRWQRTHRPLALGERLLPRRPFVLQGAFDEGNLEPRDAAAALRHLGTLARSIRHLPDGATISFAWPTDSA